MKILYLFLFHLPICCFSKKGLGQNTNDLYQNVNTIQILNYKPEKAKNGKDGKDRIFVLQIFKGPKAGKDGKDGKKGEDLNIFISKKMIADLFILKVEIHFVNQAGRIDSVFVNPRYGQLKIIADGGDGGTGGKAETGGVHGTGGKAGKGGNIIVHFDSATQYFFNNKCLIFSNKNGEAGYNGDGYTKNNIVTKNESKIEYFDADEKIIFYKY
jgi:hypothetical protein